MTQDDSDTSGTSPTRRKRSDGLRTIERVLKAAEEEMAEFGFVKFNLDRVMEKSGVARSSVYHHFGGRDGVIAALETTSTMRSLERGTAEFEAFLDTLSSGEKAFELIELGIRSFRSSDNKRRRQRRISSLAASHNSAAIREVLANEQRSDAHQVGHLGGEAQHPVVRCLAGHLGLDGRLQLGIASAHHHGLERCVHPQRLRDDLGRVRPAGGPGTGDKKGSHTGPGSRPGRG